MTDNKKKRATSLDTQVGMSKSALGQVLKDFPELMGIWRWDPEKVYIRVEDINPEKKRGFKMIRWLFSTAEIQYNDLFWVKISSPTIITELIKLGITHSLGATQARAFLEATAHDPQCTIDYIVCGINLKTHMHFHIYRPKKIDLKSFLDGLVPKSKDVVVWKPEI